MTPILTLSEIEARFDSEWILVEDPEVDKDFNVVRGKVVSHSKDRDEVYQDAIKLKPKHFAMLFTGTIPEDTAVVL